MNPGLWSTIQQALGDSEYFIVLASPEAAQSKWVAQELDYWLRNRGPERLFIVLTSGDIVWDVAARDFDWQRTTALPPSLRGALTEEPLYLDLRWARTTEHLSLRHPRFRDAIADLAAPLHGVAKDTLIGEDVRQHRRTVRITTSAVFALVVLALGLAVSGRLAVQQRDEARRQAHVAKQRLVRLQVANGSRLVEQGDVCGSLVWFSEAARLGLGDPAEERVLLERVTAALQGCPALSRLWFANLGADVDRPSVRPFPVGSGAYQFPNLGSEDRYVFAFLADGTVRVWDVESGADSTPPRGHAAGRVTAVRFTRDAARILSADGDAARLWDAKTGTEIVSLRHQGPVEQAAFSSDGSRVVTASADGTARVWNAYNGAQVTALPHGVPVVFAAFSADGRKVVTFADDNKVRVWDPATRRSATLKHDLDPLRVELSPDGMLVLTVGAEDSGAHLWRAETGELVSSLGDWAGVDLAEFSPDGRWVAMATRFGWAILWDVNSDQEGKSMQLTGLPVSLAFSADSKRLVTAGTGGTAQVWDVKTGKPIGPPLWHEDTVHEALFTPNGTQLATVTPGGVVRVWDLEPAGVMPLKHDGTVRYAAFDPDGTHLLTATDFAVEVWDLTTHAQKSVSALVLETEGQISTARFSPDGKRIVTGDFRRAARVWDARTGKPLLTLRHEGHVQHCAYSRDGARIVTAAGSEVSVWDASTGQRLASMRTGAPPIYVEFSPDGKHVLSVDFDDTARVWEVASAKEIASLQRHDTNRATYSPDGTRIAAASVEGSVRVWDAATGAPVSPSIDHDQGQRVMHLAFSPDGKQLLTASAGNIARVWDASTGRPVTPPLQHDDRLMYAEFNPDGRNVLTASVDGTARVWDAATGEPLTPPLKHRFGVRHAAFSPDGRRVVTAGEDQFARVWDLFPAAPSIAELVALSHVLAVRRVDDTGALVSITSDDFRVAWRALHPNDPN